MKELQHFSPDRIRSALTINDVLEPVAHSLIAYSQGRAERPPLGLITLDNGGEVHIKSGYLRGGPYYVTKIASMVAANRMRGGHSSDGVMLLCSAETGYPLAVLHDRKYLTDIRTAAVGALAARLLAPAAAETVGIIGTGGQAVLQAEALRLVRPFRRLLLLGRDPDRAAAAIHNLRQRLPDIAVEACHDAAALCRESRIIITATAATAPLVRGDWLQPGTHITALGADDIHKWEIDPVCFRRAAFVAVDSHDLAEKFGDIPNCRKAAPDQTIRADAELGELLSGALTFQRQPDDITISKHIGLGVEDVAAAGTCYEKLVSQPPITSPESNG